MIKGFKEFIMRGNVVDLAVGIAIGVAFTSLVAAFGTYFINPLVASVGGSSEKGLGFQITDSSKTLVDIGGLINALIVFVVTMAVIYFAVVVPVQKLQERRKTEPEAEAVPEDLAVLREIRDALLNQTRPSSGGEHL
ncbi:large conductance mechanosensitive channel protein MscL [Aeromicrobium sp.]|uniref:large conductance mechanosensitive channel protein MscL n=1 Tax=Aeromicrobium sp. TaxID=1871063 RepID=UPI003D6A0FB8